MRYLLASLVVVIVGGMGSIVGAAIGVLCCTRRVPVSGNDKGLSRPSGKLLENFSAKLIATSEGTESAAAAAETCAAARRSATVGLLANALPPSALLCAPPLPPPGPQRACGRSPPALLTIAPGTAGNAGTLPSERLASSPA